ncbi:FtsQ-type POTRA domain-containing protein [Candidatus Microgenomates bacterium]|nr:MAG: FtsQ-type POTRA domain-containing protein [Candidatus Microgenomates bacterium]
MIFTVRTITIVGNEQLITNQSPLTAPTNILYFNKKKLHDEVLRLNPLVLDVDIQRVFPNGLSITLTPRTPVLLISTDTGDFFLDKHGEIIPGASTVYDRSSYVQIACNQNVAGGEQVKIAAAAAYAFTLQNYPEIQPQLFTCAHDRLIIAVEELVAYVPYEGDIEATVSSLHFLLKQFRIEGQHPKAVDLRFEKPVLITDWYVSASPSTAAAEAE